MTGLRLLSLFIGVFVAGVAPVVDASAQPDRRGPRPHPFVGAASCAFDRVLLGPSGTEVAVWPDASRSIIGTQRFAPPTEVIVGRMHDPRQRESDKFFSYHGSGLRLYPIRWSSNGSRLYVRVREQDQRVVAFTADGGPVDAVADLDASWSRIDLNSVSHGDVAALTDPRTVSQTRRIDFTRLIRGSGTLGAGLELLAVRRSDLALLRLTAAGESQVGLNASQIEMLSAFGSERDYPAGVSYAGAPIRGLAPYFPYQLPILDLGSGRVAGAFGPFGLAMRIPGRLHRALDQFRRTQADRRLALLDASYSSGALVVLTVSGSGDRKLFRVGDGGISEQPLCAQRASVLPPGSRSGPLPLESIGTFDAPTMRAFSLDESGREIMAPGRPILLQHSIASAGARDAVIFFQGGPGTAGWPGPTVGVLRVLAPGRDVITVEYSGSQGGGVELTRRLAWHGVRALEEDLDATVRWLRRQQYRRVFVVGVSFGGVPAMVAMSHYPSLFSRAFFVAPLLRYRNPEEWAEVGTSGLGPVMSDTQLARDHAYYGGPIGRARFAAELQALVTRTPLGQTYHFYFGAADPVSKREDLPPQVSSPILIRPGGHGWATADAGVWDDIVTAMQRP